jgi:hypothetical protein
VHAEKIFLLVRDFCLLRNGRLPCPLLVRDLDGIADGTPDSEDVSRIIAFVGKHASVIPVDDSALTLTLASAGNHVIEVTCSCR